MVSASGCGPEGRGFESHISPQKKRKAPHGPGESPSVQVSKDRQQTRRPSGHLHTGRCFLPNKALPERKTESTPRRADRKTESGCSAVGSARGLGACDRLVSRPPKARKISVFLAFPRFSATVCFGKKLLTTDLTTYGFDRKKLNIFTHRGVAQLVAREVWDFDAVGSNPATPTKNQSKMRFSAPLSVDFFAYNRLLSTTLWKSPDGRNAACAIVTAQAAFFRKAFSLTTATQFLRVDRHELYKQSNNSSRGTVYCFSLKFCYNNIRNRRRFQYNSNGGT